MLIVQVPAVMAIMEQQKFNVSRASLFFFEEWIKAGIMNVADIYGDTGRYCSIGDYK